MSITAELLVTCRLHVKILAGLEQYDETGETTHTRDGDEGASPSLAGGRGSQMSIMS